MRHSISIIILVLLIHDIGSTLRDHEERITKLEKDTY